MFGLLLCLWIVILAGPSSAQDPGDGDLLRPASDTVLRPDAPTAPVELPAMVELQELVQAQRWSDAARLASQLVAKTPQEPRGYFWLGYVQLRQHDDLAAIRSLRRAQTLGLQDPQLPKTLGLAYYAIHQFILFREQMQKAIEATPGDAWPYYYLGVYDITVTENYQEGLKRFGEALSREPNEFRILSYHGFCQEILGALSLARRDYEAAIRLVEQRNARFSLPYQRMALLLAESDPVLALRFAKTAAEQEDEIANNHLVLAKLYEDQGRTNDAVDALKAAVQADPTQASPHYRLHRLFTKLGNEKAAAEALEEFQNLSKLYGS